MVIYINNFIEMIPNFESTNTALLPNSYGFQGPNSYHGSSNNNVYNNNNSTSVQPQSEDAGKAAYHQKYIPNTFKDFYQYQNMKDAFSLFTNFQHNVPMPSTRFGAHFGGGGGNNEYYPGGPYSFFDRIHEMEAKIPLDFARVWLDHQNLWRRFSVCGNEMIITKLGRRMFPVLSFGVHSLNFSDLYTMEVEALTSDSNRYKYVSVTGWRVNGVASQQEGNKIMYHPEGVQTGEYWQKNGVAFKRIKLTNKKTAKEGSNNIVLNSMHKYHIQLIIKQIGLDDQVIDTKKFEFRETEFIAVTAYQNDDVTQLKIDHNPFAKAFRDNATDHCDRVSYSTMYAPQPKRRKYDEFDLEPKQSHTSSANKIYATQQNNDADATFSLPLTTTSVIHQIGGADEKNRQLYNGVDNYNCYANLSSQNFHNNQYNVQSSLTEWIPHINFDDTTNNGAPLLPNIHSEESHEKHSTDRNSQLCSPLGHVSNEQVDFSKKSSNMIGQTRKLLEDDLLSSSDEKSANSAHIDGRI